jgi:hypothetical protein
MKNICKNNVQKKLILFIKKIKKCNIYYYIKKEEKYEKNNNYYE